MSLASVIAFVTSIAGCTAGSDRAIVLATTTSVDDSGLLGYLLRAYAAERPSAHIRPLAVGSGEALELGRRGDADLLIVHSPVAEEQFMAAGHGEVRVVVMRNDYVIVGPPTDPADVAATATAERAFEVIASSGQPFLSRGDQSGTHRRELAMWREAGIPRSAAWYLEAGQGMGPLLQLASERRAYALSDRATFFTMQPTLDLAVLYEDDPRLRNIYSVILVGDAGADPAARDLLYWISSEAGGEAIASYRDGQGRQLFYPLSATESADMLPGSMEFRAERQHPPIVGGEDRLSGASSPAAYGGGSNIRHRFLCRSVPPRLADPTCG